jgi:hypothetical protein
MAAVRSEDIFTAGLAADSRLDIGDSLELAVSLVAGFLV